MGRHRRSAAGRAATGHAPGGTHAHHSASGAAGTAGTAGVTGAVGGEGHQDAYAGGSQSGGSHTGRQAPRGIAPYLNPEAYADATARAHAYLFEAEDGRTPGGDGYMGGGFIPDGGPADGSGQGGRRRKKTARPVRTGLLGMSAAVALGTAAVATGVVPGLQHYKLGGASHTTGGDRIQAAGSPTNTATAQGGTSGSAGSGTGSTAPAGGSTGHVTPPTPSPSASPSASTSASASPSNAPSSSPSASSPSKPGSPKPQATRATPVRTATRNPAPAAPAAPRATPSTPKGTPSHRATKAPTPSSAPVTVSAQAAAEAQVLKLVNEERAKVGCSPLTANSSLTRLAESFSDDMAARDFFDHTDPNGRTPWDRAAAAGVTELGGENIARGQADAAAVVQAWMNSPGHRANILNCDFRTLGVGVHFGPGGPWWTQDFGY
ncbi:CAP domain-containing protein [Streptomyces sp. NPDC051133]|uniref:CAP domain-containing protein n=1 Tax=Streptomyces sp. NPDC051133 TaxID=3155521 RepID=UPI003427B1FE